jgi:NADPH:quinone reductase-like Zn-dependent oxidoreductase
MAEYFIDPTIPTDQCVYRVNGSRSRPGFLRFISRRLKPVLSPAPDEALVKVDWACLSHRDLMIRQGRFPNASKVGLILGCEFSGRIVAMGTVGFMMGLQLGQGVVRGHHPPCSTTSGIPFTGMPEGVFGVNSDGALQQYIKLPLESLVCLPAEWARDSNWTWPWAPSTFTGLTAWNALHGNQNGPLRPRQTVVLAGKLEWHWLLLWLLSPEM